ncbi:MAG: OmpA family protein [Polyangiaceae bacterium]|nr:OmpA family protein [Polyangiaceae bacterium]
MNTSTHVSRIALALVVVGGCVGQGTYDKAVEEGNAAKAQLRQMTLDRDKKRTEAAESESSLRELDAACKKRGDDLAALQGRSRNLSMTLEQTKAQLAAMQRAQAASEARAALFRDLTLRLKRMVDSGELAVVIRDGRMVLQLPNDVLFDTGRTELKPKGQETLKGIAEVLKTMTERHFQISGHTDSVPIHTARFPSNWELSSGRALEVVHLLVAQGVAPGMLSAAGYSDVDPVATNDTADGKKKNRRTEISLQPMIDELVTIPEH